jgi:putative ABC transport system permease protein
VQPPRLSVGRPLLRPEHPKGRLVGIGDARSSFVCPWHLAGVRSGLVVVQVELGPVLLSCAAVLGAAFLHFPRRDLGFRTDHLVGFVVGLPGGQYNEEKQIEFCSRLLERLRGMPGVVAAASGSPPPLTGAQMTISFNIEERPSAPSARPRASIAMVTPEYFRTLGTPLVEGRDFTDRDDHRAPAVVLVNQAFAEKFFPGENGCFRHLLLVASLYDSLAKEPIADLEPTKPVTQKSGLILLEI